MKLFLTGCCIIYSLLLSAQTEEEKVEHTIQLFFEGMEKNDTAKIRATLDTAGCFLKTMMKMKDGRVVLVSDNIEDFFTEVINASDLKVKEQLLSFDIKIDGVMAVAWTPYKFFVNDQFSHCGVNVFTLIKRTNDWQIIGIADTRRKKDCE